MTSHAMFRAGLELSVLHLGLVAATVLVRAGLLRSSAPVARLVRAIAAPLDVLGTDRGGMLVQASGLGPDGAPVSASWSLVAEAGDGPFIPTLPALAALRALADGALARPGATACVGVLSLAQIEREFAAHRITTTTSLSPASLYEQVLGPTFAALPGPIRRMHQPSGVLRAAGAASVEGPGSLIARLVAAAFRFPPAADEVPLTVVMAAAAGRERWTRSFGTRRFASTLSPSARPGRLIERFGPFRFELDLHAGPDGIASMPILAWRLGFLPLPHVLAPISLAREWVDNDCFHFDVELRLPFRLGRLVHYRGWLIPESSPLA